MIPSYDPSMILAILPEILLFALAVLILIIDLIWNPNKLHNLGWVAAAGFVLIMVVAIFTSRPEPTERLIFGGMLRQDWPAFTFRLIFLFAAGITSLLSVDAGALWTRGEYYALLAVTTLGMVLMASSADLIMLYLAIETTSIPLYILAGFMKTDDKSTEAGMKYFLFGAMASAVMLYGFSLLFGFTGETNIYQLVTQFHNDALSPWFLGGAAILVLVGFGFKVSAVPFHFWAPDVYEGAPTPITAYISTASKAAGFAVLVRVMLAVFPAIAGYWSSIVASMAVASMTVGNLIALAQTNIKRLLAYSSIAHAGYALIGLVALSSFGVASVVFYLVAYVVTNLAAFAIVVLFARSAGSEEIEDYAGLSRRSPGLAFALLIAFLSLAGMPPLAGFVAKVYVFAAAVESHLIWLAFIGVLNAIIGLYYYLTVLKVVYLYRSEDENLPIPVSRSSGFALGICIIAIVMIGTLSGPWLNWAVDTARSLF
jgi:NADH-quinone oxidoreductase subunit N